MRIVPPVSFVGLVDPKPPIRLVLWEEWVRIAPRVFLVELERLVLWEEWVRTVPRLFPCQGDPKPLLSLVLWEGWVRIVPRLFLVELDFQVYLKPLLRLVLWEGWVRMIHREVLVQLGLVPWEGWVSWLFLDTTGSSQVAFSTSLNFQWYLCCLKAFCPR